LISRYAPTYTYNDIFNSLTSKPRELLEKELISRLSNIFQVKYIFLLKTARVGLYTILKAYNRVGSVLLPAYNCITVPHAVHYAGYRPRFVDIDLHTLNVLPEVLERMITPDTTAVIPTHLFGIPCNLEEILPIFKNRDILIIEDAAPALGAEYMGKKVGRFGEVSVVSFGGRKVISGEAGGAIMTNNDDLAKKIHQFLSTVEDKSNKWAMYIKALAYKTSTTPEIYTLLRKMYSLILKERVYEIVPATYNQPRGYLAAMPGFASALVQLQLDRLDWNLSRRRRIAQIYRDRLANQPGWSIPEIPPSSEPSWIHYPLVCDDKLAFYDHMKSEGIDVSWTYKYSCAESFGFNDCPGTQQAAKKVASLPTTPFLTDQQAEAICSKALKFSHRLHQ